MVESGREVGFDWDLGWYPDPEDANSPCVVLIARSDNKTSSTASCPPEPTRDMFASWATNGVTGQAVVGYLSSSLDEVTPTEPSTLQISEPIHTLNGGRVFVQFVATADKERIVVSSGDTHLVLELED